MFEFYMTIQGYFEILAFNIGSYLCMQNLYNGPIVFTYLPDTILRF